MPFRIDQERPHRLNIRCIMAMLEYTLLYGELGILPGLFGQPEEIVIQGSYRVRIRDLEVQPLLFIQMDELLNHVWCNRLIVQICQLVFHLVYGVKPCIRFMCLFFGEAALDTSARETPRRASSCLSDFACSKGIQIRNSQLLPRLDVLDSVRMMSQVLVNVKSNTVQR